MAALEAEDFGGAAYVAVVFVELFQDEIALVGIAGLVQRGEVGLGGAAGSVAIDQRRQVLALEGGGGGIHDDDALDHVAQLAYVARPGIAHEHIDGFVGDFAGLASVGGCEFLEKIAGEERDIFFALAQGRDEKRNHVEAVEKIFAKISPGDFFFEIFVGGGDHADIDGGQFFAADRSEALFFERAQNLGLRLQAHVSDFVEKERTSAGLLEFTFFVGGCARERSFVVTEEFALDEIFGDGGAVDLDESLILAQALAVDGVGDQLFAGAGLAVDQNAAVGGRHQADLLAQGLHRNTVTDDDTLGVKLFFQVDVFAAQFLRFDRVLDHEQRALDGERLFEEVIGAEFGGADGGFDGAVAGDHDHFRRILERADFLQSVEAVDAGHPDIEQDNIEGGFSNQVEAGFAALGAGSGVTLIGEDAGEGIANAAFIVNDQYVMHAE